MIYYSKRNKEVSRTKDNVKGGALTEVTFLILLSLYEPRHGYAVMQFIEEMTGGRLTLGAGTLYGALTTLEKKGWIEPFGEDDNRRKVYRITDEGRAIAVKEKERLEKITRLASDIMGGSGV